MANRQVPRDRGKQEFWRGKIAEHKASGLSQTAFCKREALNPNTFSSWKKILQTRDAEEERQVDRLLKKASANRAARAEKAQFIPLVPPATKPDVRPAEGAVAELSIAGTCLRILAGADCRTLCALIRALKESERC
jgi:hypothetical protein